MCLGMFLLVFVHKIMFFRLRTPKPPIKNKFMGNMTKMKNIYIVSFVNHKRNTNTKSVKSFSKYAWSFCSIGSNISHLNGNRNRFDIFDAFGDIHPVYTYTQLLYRWFKLIRSDLMQCFATLFLNLKWWQHITVHTINWCVIEILQMFNAIFLQFRHVSQFWKRKSIAIIFLAIDRLMLFLCSTIP